MGIYIYCHQLHPGSQAAQQSFELALSYSSCSSSDAATIKAAIERLALSEDEDDEEV